MLKAKRAVEAMIERGEIALHLPNVSHLPSLVRGLLGAGITVSTFANDDVDVRALRERLGMTREQFALRYNLSIESVTKWEIEERKPDRAANNYLRVIASDPDIAARSQEEILQS
jgi:putative transcriptional regulator